MMPRASRAMSDYMFYCDGPGCSAVVPTVEALRGTGKRGMREGRRYASEVLGWSSTTGGKDFCPEHGDAA